MDFSRFRFGTSLFERSANRARFSFGLDFVKSVWRDGRNRWRMSVFFGIGKHGCSFRKFYQRVNNCCQTDLYSERYFVAIRIAVRRHILGTNL